MIKRKHHISGHNLTVSRYKKRPITSEEEKDCFDNIPVELVINILSKLPSTSSKAQCRCVSKLWSSTIRRPNYNELFPVKTPATPRLLFAFHDGETLFFNSSPQTHNPDKKSSHVATIHHNWTFVSDKKLLNFCRPVRGLVCLHHIDENNCTVAMITNPVTGESLTLLPKLRMARMKGKVRYYFGYDPIEKQFKVLRITWLSLDKLSVKFCVLTLETGNRNHLSWRMIECHTLHYPLEDNGICINGVLYYPSGSHNNERRMVCFDVRSEEFSFINVDQDLATKLKIPSLLINYKGKLGACDFDLQHGFELWVLEDAEKHKWSKHAHSYHIPHAFGYQYFRKDLRIAGTNGSGEIVLWLMDKRNKPPGLVIAFFYNVESNITTSVRIELPVLRNYGKFRVHAFPNFVEDVRLI